MDSGRLWSAGLARRSLLPGTRTHNPTPAAVALIGKRRLSKSKQKLKHATLGRRRSHRGNPLPAALLGVLGGKLGKRLKSKEAAHAERMARLAQLAERALANDASALAEIQELTTSFATQRAKDAAKATLAAVRHELASREDVRSRERRAETAASQREARAVTTQRLGILGQAAGQIGTALTRAPKGLLGGARRAVGRVATSSAGRVAGGAGASAAAAGGASAAAVAGVAIAGLAIGAAIGTGLRLAFGEARAVRAEVAQEEVNRQIRAARAEVEAATGRKVTATEARQIFNAAIVHLQRLGFEQKPNGQWHRPRSAVERLLG